MLNLLALPAYTDNYIWLLADENGDALVIDPGDAAPVIAAERQGLTPRAVLITHHHWDHVDGLPGLRERFDLRIIGPAGSRADVDERVDDGDRVRLDAPLAEFDVVRIPGHTLDHVAYVGDGRVFCGDTLFSLGCGRLFEGTPAQMLASLDRLAALPDDTLVCCGHEYTEANARFARTVEPDNPALAARSEEAARQRAQGRPSVPSTLGDERACNPFLRVDVPAVADAIARHEGARIDGRVERFAALRRWKDRFRA